MRWSTAMLGALAMLPLLTGGGERLCYTYLAPQNNMFRSTIIFGVRLWYELRRIMSGSVFSLSQHKRVQDGRYGLHHIVFSFRESKLRPT